LTIKKEYRGQGFGKKILEAFENNYLKNDTNIFLVAADFNPKAKNFYEQNGYRQFGKIPGLYKQGTDECLMMKILR
jgi:ribosomal protein S18 acetylase RimI-like enzyme